MTQTNNPKVDLKDLKILQMLDKNARMPFIQIGKAINLPESVVRYRVERMQKTGVIKGFLTFIDTERVGYGFHNIYIRLKVISENTEKRLIHQIKKISSVGWLASVAGHYNLIVAVLARNTQHFHEIFNEVVKVLGTNILEDAVFMVTEAAQLPYPLLPKDDTILERHARIGTGKKMHLEPIDFKILHELSLNCRVTNQEISKKLGASIDKISEHLDKLLESDLIQGFKPLIDMSKLGKQWYIILFRLKYADEEARKGFVQTLKSFPETFFVVTGVGNWGMQVEFFCDGHRQFREVLNKIFPSQNSNIVRELTELKVIEEHKCFFYPVELVNEELQENLDIWVTTKDKKELDKQKELEI